MATPKGKSPKLSDEKRLTPRQERLAKNLANPKIKTVLEAAEKAGYKPSVARSRVYGLIQAPAIKAAVRKRINRALANAEVSAEEVIGSAAANMRTSLDDCVDKDGRFDIKKARATGAIDFIKKIKVTEHKLGDTGVVVVNTEIELESPASARKELANYMGIEKFGNDGTALLADFKRISARISEEAILQKVSEKAMAEFFLSDERTKQMDPEIIRMIHDRFLK